MRFYRTTLLETVIQGPIAVCDKVFAKTNTCQYVPKEKLPEMGELVEYRFHNRVVKADLRVNAIYEEEWVPQMADFLTVLARSEVMLVSKGNEEC